MANDKEALKNFCTDRLLPILKVVDKQLDEWLPKETDEPARLHQAMRYSVFAGGKRVRPILMIMACRAAGGKDEAAMPAACAIECIHTYSLIHDDLPAMDDDDLRRGRPSNHKQFDEATAILAGDALLTFAFELVTKHDKNPARAAKLAYELAYAAGNSGMVGGQMADLLGEDVEPNEKILRFIHERKTGALIRAAVRCGAIAAEADQKTLDALTIYGDKTGLAFQIADDILDATATTEQLGKTAGKDAEAKKMTFVNVYGLDKSRIEGRKAVDIAISAIAPLGPAAEPLREMAEFIIARTY